MVENTESGQSQTFDVDEPFVLIGQSPGCHLRLMHPDVSFRHAYCQVVQGRLYVYDLETEHGTIWGTGVRREGSLTPDSRLQIGPFIVRLSRAPAFTCSLQPTTEDWQPENEPLEDVRLWFENATGRTSHSALRPLRRQITVLGRSNRCHLKLSDSSVSKAHCAIVRTEVGYWVVDLLGRAGTTINGQNVRFSAIGADDVLGAGRFRMKIRELVPSETLEAPTPGPDSAAELPAAAPENAGPGATSIVLPRSPVAAGVTEQHLAQSRQSLSFHATRLPNIPESDGERGTSDALILAMMEQFSHLQQQLLTHTQQQMSMLTEMFATLHKAQNEAVMSQLQRIQEISTELNTLRAETAAGRIESHGPASVAPTSESNATAAAVVEAETPPAAVVERDAGEPTAGMPEPASDDVDYRASASADAGRGLPIADDSDVVPVAPMDADPTESSAALSDAAASGRTDEPERPRSQKSAAIRPRKVGSRQYDATAHARLTMRISELERERTGNWRKLMQLVGGALDE